MGTDIGTDMWTDMGTDIGTDMWTDMGTDIGESQIFVLYNMDHFVFCHAGVMSVFRGNNVPILSEV